MWSRASKFLFCIQRALGVLHIIFFNFDLSGQRRSRLQYLCQRSQASSELLLPSAQGRASVQLSTEMTPIWSWLGTTRRAHVTAADTFYVEIPRRHCRRFKEFCVLLHIKTHLPKYWLCVAPHNQYVGR